MSTIGTPNGQLGTPNGKNEWIGTKGKYNLPFGVHVCCILFICRTWGTGFPTLRSPAFV